MNSRARAACAFTDLDVGPPSFVARAPGRVNLIGEHTDYNDGFVLPMALPFDTTVVGTWTGNQTISVASEGFPSATFQIGRAVDATVGWARYVHGMAALLADSGHPVNGWTGAIATDIPTGASLSSSAALEVATGLAMLGPHFRIPPTEMARIGQRVENEVMGLPSGIMDQLASAGSVAGAATLIDCRDLTLRPVPLPEGVTVVVMDTGTRRELVGSEYADRRDACMRAAAELGVASLRDATVADLRRLDAGVHHVERRRARHVITEIQRTLDAVAAMEGGDAVALGELMCASHASLRDDYEVSSPALDLIVDIAQRDPGCLGARMTGGGFAGGAIALVSTTAVDSFCAHVLQTFEAPPAQRATTPTRLYPVLPSAGASIDVLD